MSPPSGMALTKWRKARALELAMAGLSFDAIAEELGYAGRSGAWKAVSSGLSDTISQVASEYRDLELARLDAVQAAYWPSALSGADIKSADLVLRVIDRRMKLLGLDQIPPPEVGTKTIIIHDETYVEQLRAIAGGAATS